tara:strand:+ start:89115 stop:90179 length:1065 start_codon:yes stop_codon:yes gene_type:complete
LFAGSLSAQADMVEERWLASQADATDKGDRATNGDPRALAELELIYEFCAMDSDCMNLDPGRAPSDLQYRVAAAAVELGRLHLDGQFQENAFSTAEKYFTLAATLGSPYGVHWLGELYSRSASEAYRSSAPIFLELAMEEGVARSALILMELAQRQRREEEIVRFARLGLGLEPNADEGEAFVQVLRRRSLPLRPLALTQETGPDLSSNRPGSRPASYAATNDSPEAQAYACARNSEQLDEEWTLLNEFDSRLSIARTSYQRDQQRQAMSTPFVPPGRAGQIVTKAHSAKIDALNQRSQRINQANAELRNWGQALTRRQDEQNARCSFPIALPTYQSVCEGELADSPYCRSIQF